MSNSRGRRWHRAPKRGDWRRAGTQRCVQLWLRHGVTSLGRSLWAEAPSRPLPSTFQMPSQHGSLKGNTGKVGQPQHVRVHTKPMFYILTVSLSQVTREEGRHGLCSTAYAEFPGLWAFKAPSCNLILPLTTLSCFQFNISPQGICICRPPTTQCFFYPTPPPFIPHRSVQILLILEIIATANI